MRRRIALLLCLLGPLTCGAETAHAEVSLIGEAQVGFIGGSLYDDPSTPTDGSLPRLFSTVDVTFTLTGETDNGLQFGASTDLSSRHQRANQHFNSVDRDTFVYISSRLGTLTLGDTDGAADWAVREPGDLFERGSLNDDEIRHIGYYDDYFDTQHIGQILRYDVHIGNFGFAASVDLIAENSFPGATSTFGLGLTYVADIGPAELEVGIGYQRTGDVWYRQTTRFVDSPPGFGQTSLVFEARDATLWAGSLTMTMNEQVSATFQRVQYNGRINGMAHNGIGLGFQSGDLTLRANAGRTEMTYGQITLLESWGHGFAASYDFGGGASLQAAYGRSDYDSILRRDLEGATYSVGLSLTF